MHNDGHSLVHRFHGPCNISQLNQFYNLIYVHKSEVYSFFFPYDLFAVALAYSLQIMDEGVIPVTSTDVLIDALVSPSGVIPISPAALEKM